MRRRGPSRLELRGWLVLLVKPGLLSLYRVRLQLTTWSEVSKQRGNAPLPDLFSFQVGVEFCANYKATPE